MKVPPEEMLGPGWTLHIVHSYMRVVVCPENVQCSGHGVLGGEAGAGP